MRVIKLPALQNVNPSTRVSLRLPLGMVYQKLYFQLGTNITKALITNLVLRLNNKEFMRWNSATDADILNAYKGNAINAGFFVLDFTERLAREEVAMTLGTVAACAEAGIQDFTLEFDLGAYTPAAGSGITAFADVEAPSGNTVVQRVMFQQKVIAAAAQEMIYLPFGAQGFQIKRLILKHTNLASVRVRRDGVEIYEDLPVALANFREQDFARVPQAGYHVVDFLPDTLQSNAFNTAFTVANNQGVAVQNLDVRLTTSAADTIGIYVEGYCLSTQL